jgi:methyltransferase
MGAFVWLMGVLALERLCELAIARRNGRWIRGEGGVEHDAGFTRWMVVFHSAWFVSFAVEGLVRPASPAASEWTIWGAFLLLQGLRYWCIASLGRFWNTGVLVLPGAPAVDAGPYRFLRHPNYLVVLIEIPLYPLMVGCWATAALFGAANVLVLRRRIRKEEEVLEAYGRS